MSRLIDADELLHVLSTSSFPQDVDTGKAYYIFRKELRNAPTVDAVPVVRCKDCQFYIEAHKERSGDCIYLNRHIFVLNTDYCSCGEKVTE